MLRYTWWSAQAASIFSMYGDIRGSPIVERFRVMARLAHLFFHEGQLLVRLFVLAHRLLLAHAVGRAPLPLPPVEAQLPCLPLQRDLGMPQREQATLNPPKIGADGLPGDPEVRLEEHRAVPRHGIGVVLGDHELKAIVSLLVGVKREIQRRALPRTQAVVLYQEWLRKHAVHADGQVEPGLLDGVAIEGGVALEIDVVRASRFHPLHQNENGPRTAESPGAGQTPGRLKLPARASGRRERLTASPPFPVRHGRGSAA
jgi:hypothetical protein